MKKFFMNDSGVTLIEYALIAALISVALITSLTGVKTQLGTTFQSIVTALGSGNSGTGG